MSLETSFSKVLALRPHDYKEYPREARLRKDYKPDETYRFLKSGQRLFDLKNDIPLHETTGNENLSEPIALIRILKVEHYLIKGKAWTSGTYKIKRLLKENEMLVWSKGGFIVEK